MHPCLAVEEIVYNILNHLVTGSEAEPCKQSLGRLAIVSKNFTEPALNVLWRKHQSLYPLLLILTEIPWKLNISDSHDKWDYIYRDLIDSQTPLPEEEDEEDEEADEIETYEPEFGRNSGVMEDVEYYDVVEVTDWTRFDYYAEKIRIFQPKIALDPDNRYINANWFQQLSTRIPFRPLLPNLRHITLCVHHPAMINCIPYIRSLLSPSITSICIADFDARSWRYRSPPKVHKPITQLINTIMQCCPSLQTVRCMAKEGIKSELEGVLPRCIHYLPPLTRFGSEGVALPQEFLDHLGHFSSLQSLEFGFIKSAGPYLPSHGMFLHLQTLRLRGHDWDILTTFLSNVSVPLVTLELHNASGDVEKNRSSTPIARDATLTTSLRRLKFSAARIPPIQFGLTLIQDHPYTVNDQLAFENGFIAVVQPLFDIESLEDLSLSFPGIEQLSNLWLEIASSRWPNMQQFELCGNPRRDPHMSLSGLLPAIHSWRRLFKLNVPVNLAVAITNQQRSTYGNSPSLIRWFKSKGSLIPTGSSNLVDDLLFFFPLLEDIEWDRLTRGDFGLAD